MSAFTSKKVWKVLIKIQLTIIQAIKDKGIKISPPHTHTVPKRVKAAGKFKVVTKMSIHHYLFQTQQKILIRRVGCSAVGTSKILMGTHLFGGNNDKRACHHFETLSFYGFCNIILPDGTSNFGILEFSWIRIWMNCGQSLLSYNT